MKSKQRETAVFLVTDAMRSPKPHETRKWGMELDSALVTLGLTCVARNRLPAGKFPLLRREDPLDASAPSSGVALA